MSRILVNISSVERFIISSGMSSQVSSAGLSGVVSIAASWPAVAGVEDEAAVSGLLLPLLGASGGGAEDMIGKQEGRRRMEE